MLYYLQSKYEEFRGVGRAGGSTKATLTCAYLKSVSVPVPTHSEQHAIACIFRTLNAEIAASEEKLATLKELFSTTLNELMSATIRVTDLDIDISCLESQGAAA